MAADVSRPVAFYFGFSPQGPNTYDDEVADPVQAHGEGDTLGPQRRGKHLGRHGPADGAPAGSVDDHEDEHEGDADPGLGSVRGPVAGELTDEDRRDDVAGEHADGAAQEEPAAADAVHGPDAGDDAYELHDVQDARHDQLHVVVETHLPDAGVSVYFWYYKVYTEQWTHLNKVGE